MPKPPTQPIQYTGPVALNTRGILSAYDTIMGLRDGKSSSDVPITLNELVNVLSFVEASIMADRIYFDGTVPPKDRERVAASADDLRTRVDGLSIAPIDEDDGHALYFLCKETVEQASQLIMGIASEDIARGAKGEGPLATTDKPVMGDVDTFFAYLEQEYGSSEGGDPDLALRRRADAALAITEAVVSGRKTFRGSKCIAGLLGAECDGPDPLDHARTLLQSCRDEAERRLLVGVLINRFRINYINALSSQDQYEAAYLAIPSIESLKSQQVALLASYLFRKIREQHRDDESEELTALFSSQHRALPIGWAILMRSEPGRPLSMFEKALQLRDPVFNAMAASKTPKLRHVHALDPDAFDALEDEMLWKHYAAIDESIHDLRPRAARQTQARGFGVGSLAFRSMRIPAVLGAGAGAALGALIGDLSMLFAAGAGVQALSMMADKGLKMTDPNDRYNVYVDHYQHLKNFYNGTLAFSRAGRSTAEQVEAVFNRPFAAPAPA